MKQYLFFFIILLINVSKVFAWATLAPLECSSLIWCNDDVYSSDWPLWIIWEFIWEMILYTAVVAVLSLMISWIFYIISFWEEERTKKAKKWITWSLVWVVVSVSAWFIINSINHLSV